MPGLTEFYFRNLDDPNYQEDILEVSDELEILVYQIKMILLTNRGQVLGEAKFGGDIPKMLFELNLNTSTMSQYLIQQIKTYSEVARGYDINVVVRKIADTAYRDAAIVDVFINDKNFFGIIF